MAAPLYANQTPNSVSVRQFIGKAPLAMVNVLTRNEARNVHDNANNLHGAWVVLPVDRSRSIVVHSYSASDFNTVAAVAKVRVTTDILLFVEYNLPETLRRLALSTGMIVLAAAFIAVFGTISYKLTSYIGSVVTGFLYASQVARSASDFIFKWFGNTISAVVVGIYTEFASLFRVAIKYIVASLNAYVA